MELPGLRIDERRTSHNLVGNYPSFTIQVTTEDRLHSEQHCRDEGGRSPSHSAEELGRNFIVKSSLSRIG